MAIPKYQQIKDDLNKNITLKTVTDSTQKLS